ncbi:hypothetical protein GGX14DRAFT_394195 [Mycena pura]|uniref:Uncharacterized protein n=1 Tax=Mycena pura TaxID=153505 RepID=A0AAD6VGF0_9AGAR|nr:hypothetical protein GGX14DRAFT_394195 [Mycena pura]
MSANGAGRHATSNTHAAAGTAGAFAPNFLACLAGPMYMWERGELSGRVQKRTAVGTRHLRDAHLLAGLLAGLASWQWPEILRKYTPYLAIGIGGIGQFAAASTFVMFNASRFIWSRVRAQGLK